MLNNYKPAKTVRQFMLSTAEVKALVGPVGCIPADTEFLTPHGWKPIGAWAPGDMVGVWSEDGALFFEPAERVAYPMRNGETFIRIASGPLNMDLSEEHRVPYYDYLGRFRVARAVDVEARPSARTIPSTWRPATGAPAMSDAEIRVRVMLAADGHIPAAGRQVKITVRKPRKVARVRELLDAARLSWSERVYPSRPSEHVFSAAWPGSWGSRSDAKSLSWVFRCDTRQCALVVSEALLWDGGRYGEGEDRFYTTCEDHAAAIQYAAHATGRGAVIRRYDDPRSATWKTSLTVSISQPGSAKGRRTIRSTSRFSRVASDDGVKYCFTTSTGFFVARCRGSVFVTGNSAKTCGALMELFRRACQQAPDPSGVRPTRGVIIRNTLSQLKTTVLPDIQAYFGPLAQWRPSDNKVIFDFPLDDGTRVKSEWLLIPLDSPDDVRRLLSLNLTFAFIEEFREVDFAILAALRGRLGRFPRVNVAPTWKGVVMVSNPYPNGSEWHHALELDRPADWDFFRQPSGLSTEAENIENLPANYYENLCEGASEGWINVHVHGRNGDDKSGAAVFGDSFSTEFHTRPSLRHGGDRTYLIGQDTDRNPASLVCQMDPVGRLLVLREVYAEGMGLETFIQTKLTPTMYESFPGRAFIVGDPSGVRRSSITEESSFQAMARLGYDAVPAPTNNIDPRLRAVEERFNSQIGGGAAILISQEGCPTLIRALAAEYRYPRSKKGELGLQPEKRHPWSDLCDALQYACLGASMSRRGHHMGRITGNRASRQVVGARGSISAAGWT